MMIQKLRKAGNSFVVTITREEMERQNLHEGDMVGIELRKITMRPEMSPDVRAAFEYAMKAHAADIDYLANR